MPILFKLSPITSPTRQVLKTDFTQKTSIRMLKLLNYPKICHSKGSQQGVPIFFVWLPNNEYQKVLGLRKYQIFNKNSNQI